MENLVVTGVVERKIAKGRQREILLMYSQGMEDLTPIKLILLTREMSGLGKFSGVFSKIVKDCSVVEIIFAFIYIYIYIYIYICV